MERKSGWAALQAALDAQLPFTTNFREFAVRVWNEDLQPGDPITPRFQAQPLDPAFPTARPKDVAPAPRYMDEVAITLAQTSYTSAEEIPDLHAVYYTLSPSGDTRRLTFNFAGLQPNTELDVDALVKIRDVGWERRELDPLVTEWCLDKPADAIEQVILVLSNHSMDPDDPITGIWTVQAEATGCATVSDGLVYTSYGEVGLPGDAFYQTVHETLTLRLNLKPPPPDSNYEADFVNNGSTHRASIDTTGFIAGIPGANCDYVSEGHGGGGGSVPGIDSVLASLAYEPAEPLPNASVQPAGQWVMVVATAIPVEMLVSETSCAGSSSVTSIALLQLPDCDGYELVDTDPARIFNFNCSSQVPGWSWSIVGKVRVQT